MTRGVIGLRPALGDVNGFRPVALRRFGDLTGRTSWRATMYEAVSCGALCIRTSQRRQVRLEKIKNQKLAEGNYNSGRTLSSGSFGLIPTEKELLKMFVQRATNPID